MIIKKSIALLFLIANVVYATDEQLPSSRLFQLSPKKIVAGIGVAATLGLLRQWIALRHVSKANKNSVPLRSLDQPFVMSGSGEEKAFNDLKLYLAVGSKNNFTLQHVTYALQALDRHFDFYWQKLSLAEQKALALFLKEKNVFTLISSGGDGAPIDVANPDYLPNVQKVLAAIEKFLD